MSEGQKMAKVFARIMRERDSKKGRQAHAGWTSALRRHLPSIPLAVTALLLRFVSSSDGYLNVSQRHWHLVAAQKRGEATIAVSSRTV